MNPLEATLNRHRGAAAYVEGALGRLESDLLATETDDQLSHRVHDIIRIFQRLKDGPKVTVETMKPTYRVILDPDGD